MATARSANFADFAAQVEALRSPLMRFARSQLRNEAWAKDAVSDTLLAALEKPGAFAGCSQLKTWLIGVLKHKLVDQLRRHRRETTVLSTEDGEDLDESLFDPTGHWSDKPQDWSSLEAACGQRQLFEVALNAAKGKTDSLNHWAVAVQSRRG